MFSCFIALYDFHRLELLFLLLELLSCVKGGEVLWSFVAEYQKDSLSCALQVWLGNLNGSYLYYLFVTPLLPNCFFSIGLFGDIHPTLDIIHACVSLLWSRWSHIGPCLPISTALRRVMLPPSFIHPYLSLLALDVKDIIVITIVVFDSYIFGAHLSSQVNLCGLSYLAPFHHRIQLHLSGLCSLGSLALF